ncbi:MAG: hypothetical protein D6689_18725 [Deltaproteobacteria bacterium]|nr:MAG: hypothetical protein D6689_18725 [Deltaproteobacteria bacterium]
MTGQDGLITKETAARRARRAAGDAVLRADGVPVDRGPRGRSSVGAPEIVAAHRPLFPPGEPLPIWRRRAGWWR